MPYGPKPKSMAERFWEHVDIRDPDRCWPWRGAQSSRDGRGTFRTGGRDTPRVSAPRAAYYLCHGYWPEFALHLPGDCDKGNCCNPLHIYDGTAQDNALDREHSGLQPSRLGERNANAALDAEKVITIWREYKKGGVTMKVLAARYGVHHNTVRLIVRSMTWAHITSALD